MLIVFDLDDTLIDTSGAITPHKISALIDFLFSKNVYIPDVKGAVLEVQKMDLQNASSRETIEYVLKKFSALHLFQDALDLYHAPLPEALMIPTTPHAKEILNLLKNRNHTLALVTGGVPAFQLEKLKKSGIDLSMFSIINYAEDFKKRPHYEAVLKKYGGMPNSCWAVGDRVKVDLEPAYALGWHTVHMRWGRGRQPCTEKWVEYSISTLAEIMDII